MRKRRQSVLNFKKPSSFLGKSEEELNLINLNDPLEETYFCKNCNKSDLGVKTIKN